MTPYQTMFWALAEWLMSQQAPWAIVSAFFFLAYIMSRVFAAMAGAAVVSLIETKDDR